VPADTQGTMYLFFVISSKVPPPPMVAPYDKEVYRVSINAFSISFPECLKHKWIIQWACRQYKPSPKIICSKHYMLKLNEKAFKYIKLYRNKDVVFMLYSFCESPAWHSG
jgi:hypothetical protein